MYVFARWKISMLFLAIQTFPMSCRKKKVRCQKTWEKISTVWIVWNVYMKPSKLIWRHLRNRFVCMKFVISSVWMKTFYNTVQGSFVVWNNFKASKMSYTFETISPCTNILTFLLLIFQQCTWVIRWLLYYGKNTLSLPCTSLHKCEQKDRTKSFTESSDYILFDYNMLKQSNCIVYNCWFLQSFKVNSVQEESAELQGSYAGDKQDEIKETEREVVDAWNHLTGKVRHRITLLDDSDEYYKFCIAVQDQLGWMNDMQRQILTYDKSRCVWVCCSMIWYDNMI